MNFWRPNESWRSWCHSWPWQTHIVGGHSPSLQRGAPMSCSERKSGPWRPVCQPHHTGHTRPFSLGKRNPSKKPHCTNRNISQHSAPLVGFRPAIPRKRFVNTDIAKRWSLGIVVLPLFGPRLWGVFGLPSMVWWPRHPHPQNNDASDANDNC